MLSTSLFILGCAQPSDLERIQKRDALHVITRNAPGIYYEGRESPEGFEYELAAMFAEHLGVELDLKIANTRSQIRSALDNQFTHMAAAMLIDTDSAQSGYLQSEAFLETTPLVVYRYGSKRPRKIEDLRGKNLAVVGDSYLTEVLESLQLDYPELTWTPMDTETYELIRMVQDREIDFALVTSHELQLHRAYYPRVKKAFELDSAKKVVWLFPAAQDKTLLAEANKFIAQAREDGTLMYLSERYFGHLAQINYVGARTFIRHAKKRLPTYEELFKKYSEEHQTDWRLMAAMGYQESHWLPSATSPTGVRGLMMLTRVTAKEMGIANRLDPEQSIKGGIAYFAKIHKRIPDDIPEPDKTWFAMAAYNVGYGHLEDAQMLTEKAGKDPKKWADVKEFLPLLQQKKYYSQTRFGYARGNEPVIYVQNIRRYYDVLRWIDEGRQKERTSQTSNFEEQLIHLREGN